MAKKKKQPKEPKEKPVKVKPVKEKNKEKGSPLVALLAVLLVLIGVGEVGLWGYIGFTLVQSRTEQQSYVSRAPENSSGSASRFSYSGPHRQVEDGVVVWEWDPNSPEGGAPVESENNPGSGGEQPAV